MRHKPIDPTDPAAVAAWVTSTRATLAEVHSLAIDATAPRGQRVHSRAHLREQLRKRHQILTAALVAIEPAAAATTGEP